MKWLNLSDNVNLLSIIGASIIILVVLIVVGNMFRQMVATRKEKVELSEHNWDGIGEYKNPLPFGWAFMFVVLILFAVWYFLIGFPLGKYSSIGEYNVEVNDYNVKYKEKYANLNDEAKLNMGESVFLLNCAPCHGAEATGINGKAQDLTKWGSTEGILSVLANGSTGLGYGEMPAGLVEGDDAKAVATYVANGMQGEVGKDIFENTCVACHGENGEGMEGVAPALNHYAGVAFIKDVLSTGKAAPSDAGVKVIGTMPSFSAMLSEEQIDAVARYVSTLSKE
ncbi:c-type cytochrome [Campylobacter sp. MG1]|uniref:c-type cytochrome n=1 Tax=Campylobacter sp. MG1 TaxID=2976332 RepID=UPI00226CE867|nr:c-type cytochrome [Campylobacter sp. MG1]